MNEVEELNKYKLDDTLLCFPFPRDYWGDGTKRFKAGFVPTIKPLKEYIKNMRNFDKLSIILQGKKEPIYIIIYNNNAFGSDNIQKIEKLIIGIEKKKGIKYFLPQVLIDVLDKFHSKGFKDINVSKNDRNVFSEMREYLLSKIVPCSHPDYKDNLFFILNINATYKPHDDPSPSVHFSVTLSLSDKSHYQKDVWFKLHSYYNTFKNLRYNINKNEIEEEQSSSDSYFLFNEDFRSNYDRGDHLEDWGEYWGNYAPVEDKEELYEELQNVDKAIDEMESTANLISTKFMNSKPRK